MKPVFSLILSAFALASCSVLHGPTADPTLSLIYSDAVANTEQGIDRAEDAATLEKEILRLCGHHEDGSTPDSCAIKTATTPAHNITESSTRIFTSVDSIPQESMGIVATQFVHLASLGATIPELPANITLTDAETEAATALLQRHHATIYGLGVALSYSDNEDTITSLISTHTKSASQLQQLLSDDLVAEAGYSFTESAQITDAASAQNFITTEEKLFLEEILFHASQAETPSWRQYLLIEAARAATSAH
ncbi:putative secreted protein [Corynebacterium kutscheri]|uniref:Secreted protein n=1 Tax=Corynebacterium kutscheri TaxID=35755 RepID=A0A0F6R008_9CORY|nr:hypothetical protein [Corynebacterium kutscheri]AKE41447.1 hypothetical protein UL82_06410 [Corynebacterium kutscheri]VEH08725.1 putative secreted protein [Corynebacterium kutscheri]VEH09771.1 putative secreted protein [Corynebacterium kutscheri]VEH79854.1 putative secreted protein [Corynebacterium kutscheri]